jgi:ribosomal protein L11 methylase PrmA
VIYDLGSGDGTALMIAAKEFGARGVGIEIDPLRSIFSKILLLRNGVSDKVKIKRSNFFKEDLKEADVIFVYLVPKTIERLLPKFRKELKKGTRIVSYRYKVNMPEKGRDTKNQLTLYTI